MREKQSVGLEGDIGTIALYRQTGRLLFSVKYATYTFSIFTSGGGVLLTNVSLYAPSTCYAYNTRCVNGGLEPSVLKQRNSNLFEQVA